MIRPLFTLAVQVDATIASAHLGVRPRWAATPGVTVPVMVGAHQGEIAARPRRRRPRPRRRRPRPRRRRQRPHNLLTYHPSARGRLGEQRASLSAAISQASTAPRRTPLYGPSSLDPSIQMMRGSVQMTWQARAPGGGPTALRGTIQTGIMVSRPAAARIVARSGEILSSNGTMRRVPSCMPPCAGCHPRPRRRPRRRRLRRRRPRRRRPRRRPRRRRLRRQSHFSLVTAMA